MRAMCLAAMACVIGLSGEASLAQDRDGLVVQTESGPVRGVHNGAVEAFLAIPDAAPPVGDKGFVTLPCRERAGSAPRELSGRCDRDPPRGHRVSAKYAMCLS